MKSYVLRFLVLALFLQPQLPHAFSAVAAVDAPRVIIVLDASGSMWGQIGGEAKIDIAKGVIGDLLREWDPMVELGLLAYGHRRKADCEDIELLIAPGTVDTAAFLEVVNAIQPKGRTPLSAAVLRAAEALKFTESRASVILVSDGIETCGMDPCTVGDELAAKGVDFRAHVVGFDLSKEEQASIRCLSEKTGGAFLAAANAGELRKALATAVSKVAQAPSPTPMPTPTPAPEPPSGEGVLRLRTLASEGGDEVKAYIRVFEGKGGLEGKRRQIKAGSAREIELEPGRYVVRAEWGAAFAEEAIEIPPGEAVEKTLVLGAGILKVRALATEGGEKLKAYYYVLSKKKDLKGDRKRVTSGSAGEFKLPAGEYVVLAQWGSAKVEAEAVVTAGETMELEIVMEGGILKLASSLVEGGDPVRTYYYILSAAKDLEGNRKQVTSGSSGKFELPAGDYVVRFTWGNVSVETDATVKAGEMTEVAVVLGGGILRLKAVAKGSGEPVKGYFYVYGAKRDMEGKRARVTGGSGGEFKLPAGKYFVTVDANKQKGDAEVEVKAGEVTGVELEVSDQ